MVGITWAHSSNGGVIPYREAGSGSPGTVAGSADDSALVHMTGADEAAMKVSKRSWPRLLLSCLW